jgi:gliding motility-associated-like protein
MGLSNSNIVDTYHTDSIFVPNAFVPKGVNKVFLPMTQYVEKTEYKLSIYDRWGLKVWETADDSEGWDGEKKEGGLYAYLIEYKNAYGEYKKITGTVMMIK